MCEIVEGEVNGLAVRAARKKYLKKGVGFIEGCDFSTQINYLASKDTYAMYVNCSPIISQNFKNDLHSFRGARNLVDHPVKGKRENVKRQKQFHERMVQGPRLVSELVSLKRKVK